MGKGLVGGGDAKNSSPVGAFRSRTENETGKLALELAEEHELVFANTYYDVGHTFFGCTGSSMIDFLLWPATLMEHVSWVKAWMRSSLRLRAIPNILDHAIVAARLAIPPPTNPLPTAMRYDYDALGLGVAVGFRREAFLKDLEQELQEVSGALGVLEKDGEPTRHTALLVGVFRQVSLRHYSVAATKPPEAEGLGDEKWKLIKERAALRQLMPTRGEMADP